MKLRLKTLLTILIIVVLYAIYYWVVPLVVNVGARVSEISDYAKKELGVDIKLKSPELKMGLIPSVWLSAQEFAIADKNDKYPFLVTNPKIKIRLIPLIFGKVNVAYFSCDRVHANLRIDKNYRIYLGDTLFVKASDSILSIDNSKMNVEKYDILLKDEIQNKNIAITGDYFDLIKFNSEKFVKFSTNTKLKVDKKVSVLNADVAFNIPFEKSFDSNEIVFNGILTNLDLADFSPYVIKYTKGKITNLSGVVNIQGKTRISAIGIKQIAMKIVVDNLGIFTKDKISSIVLRNKLNVDILADIFKKAVVIKGVKLDSKNLHAVVSGKILRFGSKNSILDLVVKVSNTRAENIVGLLPPTLTNPIDINLYALKKYGFYGDVDGDLTIKGKYLTPKVEGKVDVKNVYVIKPLAIPKAKVDLNFIGTKVDLDVFVPVGKSEYVSVKGPIDLYGSKKADLDIFTTQSVDLETTQFILNPVHEVFNFEIGPVPVMKLKGVGNIKLKVKGDKANPHLTGVLNFIDATASFNDLNAIFTKVNGEVLFKDKMVYFKTHSALMDSKPVNINGKCSVYGDLDFEAITNGQNLIYMYNVFRTSKMLSGYQKILPPMAKVGGKMNLKIKVKGKVKNINDFVIGKTIFVSGHLKLLGNAFQLNSFPTPIKNIYGDIDFDDNEVKFDLYSLVNKSKIYVKGRFKDEKLDLKMNLKDLAFSYKNTPVKIYGGNLEINNNRLVVYKLNAVVDSMPILIDGMIDDIFNKPVFNLYINSKPSQKFIDKYINKTATYPLKVKGDIIYSARITGARDAISAKTEINMEKDSSIYYMGSTIGDVNNPIRIFLDAVIGKNSVVISNFQYDKLISSQNDREFVSPQLSARGEISFTNNNVYLHNFRVRTQNPTDAKVFNILFKKSMIKQGMFTSNVILNGPASVPKMIGFLNFNGVDIPLLDTTIKDISLNFDSRNIDIKAKGEMFGNKIALFANMQNDLTPPYDLKDVDIYLGNLDINKISKSLNQLQIDSNMNTLSEPKSGFDLSNWLVKDAKLKADSVLVKNVYAKDLTANFSISEKMLLSLKDFKFGVADGTVSGNFKYNLLNKTSSLDLYVEKVNANNLADTLFDLPNQIYGSLTGQANLVCNGSSHKACMETLSGNAGFRVANGRMPKLGSMEYLLRAANLVKSGVTGLTINSLIGVVAPLKTGDFENINGNFEINKGFADSVQIFSKGKDLSLFVKGTYNFSTQTADLDVFGRLAKKASNVLGPVGNTSLNTLFNAIPGLNLDETNKAEFIKNFNKIPGFELNDKKYRVFSVDIYGDISGENYVQSFKWVE